MRCGPHCGERTKTTVMWEPGPGVQWGEGVAAPCPTPNRGPQSIQNSKSSKLSIRKSQTEPPQRSGWGEEGNHQPEFN